MTKTTGETMKWPFRLLTGMLVVSVLVIVTVVTAIWSVDYLVDVWWFNALDYGIYFWQRTLYSYTLFFLITLVFFLIFFLNLRIAARFFKKEGATPEGDTKDFFNKIIMKATGSAIWFGLFSLIVGISISFPLFQEWEKFLFFILGPDMGITDPFLGKDIGFYLFSFPIFTLVQHHLLIAVGILFALILLLYVFKNKWSGRSAFDFLKGDRFHLGVVFAILTSVGIWEFMLQRYSLLYDTTHAPLFTGPGYAQMHVTLPLIWICIIMLALFSLSGMILIFTGKGSKLAIFLAVLFAGAFALRSTDYLPKLVQDYMVGPNQLNKESDYITKHVQATLDAYKLTDIDVREFAHKRFPREKSAAQMDDVLMNIPVWDGETLVYVFQQLQELRTYYQFPTVSVGRYDVNGRQQQVFLSPREIEFSNLPGEAINWINKHMTYTHGFGVVMTPASQISPDAMTWFMHNIPTESAYGLTTDQPRIYYGLGEYTYSFAPNKTGEMDYPQGNSNMLNNYDGRGGIPVNTLFTKALLAYETGDKDIFFSTEITKKSKFLYRRNIVERIKHLTPFLLLDEEPYVAVTKSGIYWIVDAYTTSSSYPTSESRKLGDSEFNYIRNSVKIVVDAYHGSVDYYIYDESDPIIRAYKRIYPTLFKSGKKLPEELKGHIRYPKDFFDIQMKIYARYHQTEPHVFYQQEDLWTFADESADHIIIPNNPYYVTLDLIDPGKTEFLLLFPMFPKNRDNLRAVAAAGCDPENYGKIVVYDFPKGKLFYGPAQIDALINQDPVIAEQFTLWTQAGSTIVRGKMLILPVENSVLFIQPVYLKATSRVKIPKLQRIIMSEGEVVVMEKTIQEAFEELKRRVQHAGANKNIIEAGADLTEKMQKISEEAAPQESQTPAAGDGSTPTHMDDKKIPEKEAL